MSQHDEQAECDLIKQWRAAEAAGDRAACDRLLEDLRQRYEADAAEVSRRVFPRDQQSQIALKAFLLWRLEKVVPLYDNHSGNSFCLFVLCGWNRFYVKEFKKAQHDKGKRGHISLDASISGDEDGQGYIAMLADSRDDLAQLEDAEWIDWLYERFAARSPEEQVALRDTINGEAGPVQRRIGLAILSRQVEPPSSVPPSFPSRVWADAAARRKLWKEASENRV